MSETPLYSSYVWLGRQLGHPVSISWFFHLVNKLIEIGIVSLRVADKARSELPSVPQGLEARYAQLGHKDPGFDPFGLSLAPGPKAESAPPPEWEMDIDFTQGTFVLRARRGRESVVLQELALCFPDVQLVPTDKALHQQDVRISGQIVQRRE